MLRRVQIETYDGFQLFGKPGIIADFESLHQMRLQAIGTPDPTYGGFAQSCSRGHRARAPVGGVEGLFLCSFANHFGYAGSGDGRGLPGRDASFSRASIPPSR